MAPHRATIERNANSATLRLVIDTDVLDIVLTDDNPNGVKAIFNRLLQHLKSGEFEFSLVDEKEDLYFHICKEYITQLNAELKSTYRELVDNGLLENAS